LVGNSRLVTSTVDALNASCGSTGALYSPRGNFPNVAAMRGFSNVASKSPTMTSSSREVCMVVL